MTWFQPITYQEAEALEGRRLDRRRKYHKKTPEGLAATRGAEANPWGFPGAEGAFVYDTWSEPCSGCSCDCGCHGEHGNGGCHECGYTGRRRNGMYFPARLDSWVNERKAA